VEVKEAAVKFPNLPVPKSSDGDVSFSRPLRRRDDRLSELDRA